MQGSRHNPALTQRAVLIVVALAAAVLSIAPANAGVWREWPRDAANLIAKTDGVAQGKGHGDWNVVDTSDGTKSRARGVAYDVRPGGDGIYFEMQTYLNAGYCLATEYLQCDAQYYAGASDQWGDKYRWYDDSWSDSHNANTGVDGSADYARGALKVCEDQDWAPDDCSGRSYTYGNKY